MKKLNIGLYGFGVVGQGLYEVLQKSKTVDAKILSVCVKHDKERKISRELLTRDQNKILNDPAINVVVELIDDAEEAYHIVKKALLNGKDVVSGNKKMLAAHLEELIQIQKESGRSLLYDASACGSIPIIRNLEEYYDNDLLNSITGILNGSSNYILTQIFKRNKDYSSALKEAQELGFAESNPNLDINGSDSLYKLVIITTHAFGLLVSPDEIFRFGIDKIQDFDVQFAKEKELKIKLVAKVMKTETGEVSLFVAPSFVRKEEYIYNVEEEYNGVVIEGKFYEKQFMFGKGAGAFPTGSAVLSDITALSYNYKYEYKKQKYFKRPVFTNSVSLTFYLRYNRKDDLRYFDFEEVYEQYTGRGSNYVIGKISLEKLIKIKDVLPGLPVFLGVM
ncbi:MAG: homoserine dehydrogenase [bacterium]|nr:MAG: homoserine dehydrogenase [bacterium]